MSILEKMRSGQDSTAMQVVIAIIIVGFIGLNGRVFGDKSAIIAKVNGDLILETDYVRVYQQRLAQMEQQSRRTLSDEDQRRLGETVKQEMIEDMVVLQEARRVGLEVSDREVARVVREQMRDRDGKFSQETYQNILKRMKMSQTEFEERVRDDLLRNKLRQLVYTGASISDVAVRDAYAQAQTRLELSLVQVRPQAFEGQVEITDDERTKWLTENEKLVRESYDRDFARLYDHPEQVQLRMISLSVTDQTPLSDLVPRLNGLRDQVVAGADMAELARRWSEDPTALEGGDLRLRAVSQLSADMTRAIEDVPAGGVSRVFTTSTKAQFVRVEQRLEPSKDEYDAVKTTIADRLIRAERVPALAQQFAQNEVLPKWAEAKQPPEDLLMSKGLFPRQTGPIPADAAPGVPPEMLEDARNAETGTVLAEVYEYGGSYFVGQLTNRTEADMSEFEANRAQYTEIVLQQRRREFFDGWIADLEARANISGS